MGYTGLARFGKHRTERWVADTLSGVEPRDYFEALSIGLNAEFKRLGYAGKIPHAFVAVGYARLGKSDLLKPLSVTVSNSLNEEGRFEVNALERMFRIHVEPLGNRRQLVLSAGWTVTGDTFATLEHRLRSAAKGSPRDPALSVVPLVLALRGTADVSKNHVGRSVLFSSLPRVAVPAAYTVLGRCDTRREPATLFLAQDVRHPRKADSYAPAIITPQVMMVGLQTSTEGWVGPTEGY